MAEVTVSVVSHGHGPLLAALLADLAALPEPRPRVILTLNIPEDETLFAGSGLEVTRIVNPVPRGFGANHNAAFAQVTTPWFAVLNPDIRLPAPPFARLIAAAADPAIALVAPRIVAADGRDEDAVRSNLTPWSLVRRHLGRRREPAPGGFRWLAGMFLLARADAFRAVGGFDERFFLYCEDYDLSARLALAGHRLLLDRGVAVVHDARRDSRRSGRHLRWHLASLARVWTSRAFLAVTWRTLRDPAALALRVHDTAAADSA